MQDIPRARAVFEEFVAREQRRYGRTGTVLQDREFVQATLPSATGRIQLSYDPTRKLTVEAFRGETRTQVAFNNKLPHDVIGLEVLVYGTADGLVPGVLDLARLHDPTPCTITDPMRFAALFTVYGETRRAMGRIDAYALVAARDFAHGMYGGALPANDAPQVTASYERGDEIVQVTAHPQHLVQPGGMSVSRAAFSRAALERSYEGAPRTLSRPLNNAIIKAPLTTAALDLLVFDNVDPVVLRAHVRDWQARL